MDSSDEQNTTQPEKFQEPNSLREYWGTKRIHAKPTWKDNQFGFEVHYVDGYVSWSPEAAFRFAYCQNGQLSFGHVIEGLRHGLSARRSGWNGKGLEIYLYEPDDFEEVNHPYVILFDVPRGIVIPWLASQSDMLRRDWELFESENTITKAGGRTATIR